MKIPIEAEQAQAGSFKCLAKTLVTARAVLGLACGLSLFTCVPPRSFADEQGNHSPRVIPPVAKAYSKSYAEWSAAFWRWNSALPIDRNPNFDAGDCQNGDNGQSGPVWFLGQGVGVPVVRNCMVPAGKAIFFSILAAECSTLEAPPFYGDDEAQLRTCARSLADSFMALACEVDGAALRDLNAYRVQSPLFQIAFPPDNVAGVPGGGTGLSVADGWYVLLAPLSKGQHTIHVHGEVPSFGYVQDITYHLTVE
jgi:hypothetical protein